MKCKGCGCKLEEFTPSMKLVLYNDDEETKGEFWFCSQCDNRVQQFIKSMKELMFEDERPSMMLHGKDEAT